MLIELSRLSPVVVNPFDYRGTLAVRIDTDDRPECGLFSGRGCSFADEEQHRVQPVIADEGLGTKVYLLDQSVRGMERDRVRCWHYAAVGWDDAIYIQHPYVYSLCLEEHHHGPADYFWSIVIGRAHQTLVHVLLSDFEPGFGRQLVSRIPDAGRH